MHYMLVNLLHSHYMQHVMYVITYPLHAFEDANAYRYVLVCTILTFLVPPCIQKRMYWYVPVRTTLYCLVPGVQDSRSSLHRPCHSGTLSRRTGTSSCKPYDATPRHHDERHEPRGRHMVWVPRHHDERLEPRGRHMVWVTHHGARCLHLEPIQRHP